MDADVNGQYIYALLHYHAVRVSACACVCAKIYMHVHMHVPWTTLARSRIREPTSRHAQHTCAHTHAHAHTHIHTQASTSSSDDAQHNLEEARQALSAALKARVAQEVCVCYVCSVLDWNLLFGSVYTCVSGCVIDTTHICTHTHMHRARTHHPDSLVQQSNILMPTYIRIASRNGTRRPSRPLRC